jgi:hypothetical protein
MQFVPGLLAPGILQAHERENPAAETTQDFALSVGPKPHASTEIRSGFIATSFHPVIPLVDSWANPQAPRDYNQEIRLSELEDL